MEGGNRLFRYIGRRLLQSILVLFCVTVFAFMLIRITPGNPAQMMLPDTATEEQIHEMEIKLGLDKSLPMQYIQYITGIFRGDLGFSTTYRVPVSDVIPSRLISTGKLTLATVICGCLISIPLGIIAGAKRGTAIDFFAVFFALLGQSMSPVWLAVLNVYIFSVWLGWLPAMGSGGLIHIILPMVTLAYPMAAEITRISRSGMIDALGEDYITSTYAKGIKRSVVYRKYAFKNALIPVVTLVGLQVAGFLAGTVIVETVYAWPGIGHLITQAVSNRDYALVQSLLLISATVFTIINLIVDIINSFIDPRIILE